MRWTAALAACGLLTVCGWSAVRAADEGGQVRTLAPGASYRFMERPEGPWRIHVISVDLSVSRLSVRSVRALDRMQGREALSSMVRRFPVREGNVLAAINADFFSLETGETTNSQVVEGEWVKGVGGKRARPRTQFGLLASGRPIIDRLMFQGSVISPSGKADPLNAVNMPADTSAFALYNSWAGGVFPEGTNPNRDAVQVGRVRVRHDTLVAVVGRECSSRDSLWLAARRGSAVECRMKSWSRGDTVRIVARTQPCRGVLRTLVGGAPRIVVNGRNVAGVQEWMEGTAEEFSARRHPRTGVGFTADSSTLIFIVVDGRQSGSDGMSLPEFADLMIECGIAQGVNLDGGGSSTMVVEGEVVNSPSDAGGERPVGNALLLVAPAFLKKPH
jgi:hypothetical protein